MMSVGSRQLSSRRRDRSAGAHMCRGRQNPHHSDKGNRSYAIIVVSSGGSSHGFLEEAEEAACRSM